MENKNNSKKELPIWNKSFSRIPEVLTVSEVAEYLRISEDYVTKLIDDESLVTIPGTNRTRIFKGFLLAFLTQNAPKDIGLAGGSVQGPMHLNPAVGF